MLSLGLGGEQRLEPGGLLVMNRGQFFVPSFGEQLLSPVTYTTSARCTQSDVMCVTTTTAAVSEERLQSNKNSEMRRIKLPFARTGPMLSISDDRKNKVLLQERQQFMERLRCEREERAALEGGSATRVQACFRGFRQRKVTRAAPVRTESRRETSAAMIRRELAAMAREMAQQLQAEMSAEDGGEGGAAAPEWRRAIQRKAAGQKQVKRMRRVAEAAATRIEAVARGFLARRAARSLRGRLRDELMRWAVMRIQSVARGASVRHVAQTARAKQRNECAIRIQVKVRWMLDREFVRVLRLLLREKSKEDRAVTKLQANFRALCDRREADKKMRHAKATKIQRGLSQRFVLFGGGRARKMSGQAKANAVAEGPEDASA